MRRFAAAVALIVLGLVWASPSASAHALLAASQPAAGSTVAASPTQITLTFTERPDARLSSVHVLDAAGRSLEHGSAQPVGGQPESLVVPVPTLAQGIYTVTWRTTSAVDGHTTAGSFSFGVGVAPTVTPTTQQIAAPRTQPPTVAAVIGRWCLYAGLALLLGAVAVGLATRVAAPRPVALALGVLLAAGGLVVMVLDQRSVARVGLSTLLRSRTGGHLRVEFLAMALVVIAVVAWMRWRSRVTLALVGLTAASAMLARAAAGHAGASSVTWFTVGTQWLHFVAIGAWAGGLPFLLGAVRRADADDRPALARRFSALATVGLAAVVITGVLRSINELGAWSRFTSTPFGKALLVKLAVVAAVVALAALNRFRNIPTLARTGRTQPLRRTVMAEVAAIIAVLGVTAVLSGFAPAASEAKARRAATPEHVVAEGHDFATTTRVRFVMTPGTIGPNHVEVTVVDYDTLRPVDAKAVALRFQYLERADVPASTLALASDAAGVWVGDGTNVALDGRWRATAVIERASGGLEVPVSFETRMPAPRITTQRTPGLPTIYTLAINDGRQVQVYLDPERAGLNQLHATYLAASGDELHMLDFSVTADGPGLLPAQKLTQRKLDDLGHYVADLQAQRGTYRLALLGTDHDNTIIRVTVSIDVK